MTLPPNDLTIVLVNSLYSSNIGATSRAMHNMGFTKLRLIAPNCSIDQNAKLAAATGQHALENRVTYSNWDEFNLTEPNGVRIALTARDGRTRAVHDLQSTLKSINIDRPLFFIFGREDHGLNGEDLRNSHYSCSLPTYSDNPSLNLAQAALLAMFVFRQSFGGIRSILDGQTLATVTTNKSNKRFLFPDETLRRWLLTLGFDLSKPRTNAYTTLRRMILHNIPTDREIKTFESVVQQTIRKLEIVKDKFQKQETE